MDTYNISKLIVKERVTLPLLYIQLVRAVSVLIEEQVHGFGLVEVEQ